MQFTNTKLEKGKVKPKEIFNHPWLFDLLNKGPTCFPNFQIPVEKP